MKLQPPPGGEEIVGDVALEMPPGGEAIEGPFSDGPNDAPRSADMRELAIMLAKQIFGAAPESGLKQAIQSGADVISQPVEFGKGLVRGAKREDFQTEEALGVPMPLANQAGQAVGRYGPPVAATMAAAAMAPAALPAAAPFAARVGQAALTAGLEGAGAATGDAASMGISKAIGGNAPETAKGAAIAAGTTGLETALGSLGVSGMIGAVKAVAPHILQSMKIVPAESLARMIDKNGEPLRGGKLTQTGAELRASTSLRKVQKAAEARRHELGTEVERELNYFQARAKGQKIIDTNRAADAADDVIREAGIGTGDAAIDAAAKMNDAEIAAIREIAEAIRSSPNKSPADVVKLRRQIDNLVKRDKSGVAKVSSDVGQRAVDAMAQGLRDGIDEAAKASGSAGLLKANSNFSRFADRWDTLRADIGTPRADSGALLARVKNLAGKFNEGGLAKARIEGLKQVIPSAAKDVESLLDYIAAREFLRSVKETPSGVTMAHWRGIITALGTAKVLPAGKWGAALARTLPKIGAGAASKANESRKSGALRE